MRVSQVTIGIFHQILEMDESTQKALLRCVFRVFTVSCDPASHTGDLFHMTFAKLSEGSVRPLLAAAINCFSLHAEDR